MRRLRLGDRILRIRDEPEGGGPAQRLPLLCIHGAGMSSVLYMDLVRRVAPRRRVIAPDLPGHGQSDPWPSHDRPSIEGYREAVGTMCARLGLTKVVLLGHSMGAAIALRCALAWPERVAGLILLNSAGRLFVPREMFELLEAVLEDGPEAPTRPLGEMPEALADLSFSPETARELRERWRAVLYAAPREVVLADFTACDGFDVMDALSALRVPTLMISGTDDLLVPPRLSEETAARIPGAQHVLLPRSAHLTHLEQPDRFHEVLDPFLTAL